MTVTKTRIDSSSSCTMVMLYSKYLPDLKVKLNLPGYFFMILAISGGAVLPITLGTVWNTILEGPPNTTMSPDSRKMLFSSSFISFLYAKYAESPKDNDTTGLVTCKFNSFDKPGTLSMCHPILPF